MIMGDFDCIETGFNCEDETLNFGSRCIALDNLYEISTLALFKSAEEDLKEVKQVVINSLYKNGHIIISTNQSIKVFEDAECSNILFNVSLDVAIASICASSDGKTLLTCLENGFINLFDLETFSLIFSESISSNFTEDCRFIACFEEENTIQTCFLVVLSTGQTFRVYINQDNIGEDTNEQEIIVKLESFYDLEMSVSLSSLSYPFLLTEGNECCILNVYTKYANKVSGYNLKSVSPFRSNFLGLDKDGKLIRICLLTLISFPIEYEYLLEDLVVIGDTQIIAVTKQNEEGNIFLQLIGSDFTPIFSLAISYPVHLISIEKTTDDILFISKIFKDEYISELRVQKVYETDIELRLKRLITRQKFEEAEQFARTVNINPIVVLKAKAEYLVAKTECTTEDIITLINLLDSINDDYFNLNCCSNVDCSNLDDVRKILEYGVKITPKSPNKYLKKVLAEMLFKFDTFMALSIRKDIESWSRFLSIDLIEEVKFFLQDFQIQDAIIVYNRLDQKSIEMSLNEENIEEILAILNNLPVNVYQPFLHTFIPITMSYKPSIVSLFVKWLLTKILQLEKRESAQFPENGLILADSMLKLLKVDKNSCIPFQRHITLSRDGLNELAGIIEALKTLQKLKKEYGINVQLAEYLQGPLTLVKTLLNIIMGPEEYEHFLKDFLCTYMLNNSLDVDTILYKEIKDLITYDDCSLTIVEVLLKCIGSVKIKLQAVKEILETCPVPWNDNVKKIAHDMLQYSHPLVEKIKNMLKDEKRYIVLKNPKYKITDRQVTTVQEFRRIVERIIYVNEHSLLEDVYNLCTSPKEREQATIILVKRFILIGNLEEAMTILDKCTKSQIYDCALWHVDFTETLFNNKFTSLKYKENYYNALWPLFRRILERCDEEFEKQNIQQKLTSLKCVHFVNNTFNRHITTNDLLKESSKATIFEELLEESIVNLNIGFSDINKMIHASANLASCFSLDKDLVLIKFCEKMGKFEVVLKAAEYLYDSEASAKNLCLTALLFLKYLASQEQLLHGNSFNDSSEELQPVLSTTILLTDGGLSETDMHLQGLKLAQKMIAKALITAKDEDKFAIDEVMNWVNTCYYLTRVDNPMHEDIYKTVYKSTRSTPSFTTFRTLREIFRCYLGFIKTNTSPSLSYLTYIAHDIPQLTEKQLLQQLSILPSTVDSFCREGLHLTAFNLLLTLEQSLSLTISPNSAVMKFLQSVIVSKCLPLLIQAVISAKYIDTTLLYNLLLASGKDYLKYISYYLKVYKRQSSKLYNISVIGLKLLDFHKETQGRDLMLDSAITCKWWKKLKTEKEIQYETFFKVDSVDRLTMLIGLDCMDVDLINDYCKDYQLQPETYYKGYLKSCLLNWKPQYEFETDFNGKTRLVMKIDETILIEKVQSAIEHIKDRAEIVALLEKILTIANFYHYEVFVCIFKILTMYGHSSNIQPAKIHMLTFLKNYQRFSQPSQREKEEWYTSFLDRQVMDPLSEYRLPFSPLLFTADVWSIIRPELNLKSYKCWFNVTNILQKNLKKDDICVYAVKQIVSSGVFGNSLAKDWILFPKFEDLFVEVDECVQYISDLERATSVVYHLMYHTPNGADKVNAAKLSFKYATKYYEKFPKSPEVEKACIKVKNKYYGFSAMHILHKYNLAQEKYIQLVANPETLIESLYMDDRIIRQAESVNLNCPDINQAVDEICVLYGLKTNMIQENLLNLWLTSSSIDVDFDSTMVFPNNNINGNTKTDETDNGLKRAIYICSNGEKEFWETYLLGVGLNDDNVPEIGQKSISFKAKALKCFCAISDEETILRLTKVSYSEFLNYIDKLTILSELECLGISLNIETLDQYSKRELLKRLSQIGKPLAIKVMGALCMTYYMDENRYWEFIINASIKLDMIGELKIYVDFLKEKYDQNYFVSAWQAIINNSFQQTSVYPEEVEEIYINNFLMIQSSPVLFLLDFEKIIKQCLKAEKLEFAAVLLQYLPKEKKDLYASDIMKREKLLLDLDKLDNRGIWGVRNVKAWLANNHL